ncbi:MAG: aspartyl protease family protein [Candidatus Kaiserbacteria bacterium]|nr:aspartyl protease family protein [Candidatus Kaiserbacteria bacterium]
MPYFDVPLENNRFIVNTIVFDAQKLDQEKLQRCLSEESFEGDDRSIARALIDTGATHCSITEDLAEKLHLSPVGKSTIGTAGHPVDCSQYVVLLGIPVTEVHKYHEIVDKKSNESKVVPAAQTNHFKLHLTKVSAMPKQQRTRGFDVIVGMDLLGKMMFQYAGNPAFSGGRLVIGF